MLSRRTLLKGLALSSASVLAGCSSNFISRGQPKDNQSTTATSTTSVNSTKLSIPESLDGMTSVRNEWVGETPAKGQPHGLLVFNSGSVGYRLKEITSRDGKQIYKGSGIPLESNTYLMERLTVPATYRYRFWNEEIQCEFIIDKSHFSHKHSTTAVEFTNGDTYVRTENDSDWYNMFEQNEPSNS
ncbi:hypothetical protein [Haladaptatus sp. NG-WS-4]